MPKTVTSGDDAAEEWSTLVNIEEKPCHQGKTEKNTKYGQPILDAITDFPKL